ncbi:MAG: MBL fold metallo-hydrolase [Gemmatimonadota bacterium]|nr:MBL fold metallo-hydrolase [Gemmatimonadota bacterium]
MSFTLTVWGARGSIPTPGPYTARYGGNTPCLALETDGPAGGRLLVLDAGTGIRPLGRAVVERSSEPLVTDLLVSHTHWDHIQGLPFFAPLFDERSEVRIWGPRQGSIALERILREQMNPVVFPVPLDELDATLRVTDVEVGTFTVGDFTVRAMPLRHPGTTFAYRLSPTAGGRSVVYVTDNELGSGGDYEVGPSWRDDLVAFVGGADLLIHDAMYTDAELHRFRGWGHSSHTEAIELAADGGVKKLVLFHHRPERDDAAMDAFVGEACALAARRARGVEVVAAVEGLTLTL